MRSTLIVRQVMQQFGKNYIFTNKYKTCRTVKCYQSGVDQEMVEGILAALNRNGVAGATINMINHPNKGWGPRNSLIVRLPL